MIDDWKKDNLLRWRVYTIEGVPTLTHYMALRKWVLSIKLNGVATSLGQLDDHIPEEDINERVIWWAEDLLKSNKITVPRSYEYTRGPKIKGG